MKIAILDTADAVKTTPRYYNANTKSRRKSLPS